MSSTNEREIGDAKGPKYTHSRMVEAMTFGLVDKRRLIWNLNYRKLWTKKTNWKSKGK